MDVDRKHIKNQKSVRENIARMSSKPLFRIQDDITNQRQQLMLVTSGLQRNAVAIDKLKKDTAQVRCLFGSLHCVSLCPFKLAAYNCVVVHRAPIVTDKSRTSHSVSVVREHRCHCVAAVESCVKQTCETVFVRS